MTPNEKTHPIIMINKLLTKYEEGVIGGLSFHTLWFFFFLQTISTELYERSYVSPVFQSWPSRKNRLKFYKIIETEDSIDIPNLKTRIITFLLTTFLHNLRMLFCVYLSISFLGWSINGFWWNRTISRNFNWASWVFQSHRGPLEAI